MNSENKPTAPPDDHGRSEALAQLLAIQDLVLKHHNATTPDERSEVNVEMMQNALSVEVRGNWHECGENEDTLEEYRILLCAGGPAVRLIGTLNLIMGNNYEPDSVRLEYQDWGTPWTDYPLTNQQKEDLLSYAKTFDY